jgi:hypothetical protein
VQVNLKKGLIPFLLALIVFGSCCYFIPFSILKQQIREEIKHSIRFSIYDSKLTQLSFSQVEFARVCPDGKDEFYINGTAYDLVRTESSNGSVRVFALEDKKEKELFRELEELVNNSLGNDKGGNSPLKAFGKLSSLKYTGTKVFSVFPTVYELNNLADFASPAAKLLAGYKGTFFTPPKIG